MTSMHMTALRKLLYWLNLTDVNMSTLLHTTVVITVFGWRMLEKDTQTSFQITEMP